MPENTRRHRLSIAGTAIMAALLSTVAAPAWADDGSDGATEVCWIEAETALSHCYPDEEAMNADFIENYGGLPIVEGSPQAHLAARGTTASVSSLYTIARLYTDINYGGLIYPANALTSTGGADGNPTADPSFSPNDAISSLRSYWGCETTLYANTSYGSVLGTWVNNSNLGSASDRMSSYKVRA